MAQGKIKERAVTLLPKKNKELREMMERSQEHFNVVFIGLDSYLDVRSKGRRQVRYWACYLVW